MSFFQKEKKKTLQNLKKKNLGFKLFLENTKNIFKSPLNVAKNFFNLLSTQKKNTLTNSTQKKAQQSKPSFLSKTLSPIKENALNFLKSSFISADSPFNSLTNGFRNPVSEGPDKKLAQKSEQSTQTISEETLNKMKNKYPFNYQLFACMNFALSFLQRANKNLSDEIKSTLLQYKNSILNNANSIPTDRDINTDDVRNSLEIVGNIALGLTEHVKSTEGESKTTLTTIQQIIVQQSLPMLNKLSLDLKEYINKKEKANKSKNTNEKANESQTTDKTENKKIQENLPTVTFNEIEADNKKISKLKEDFSGNYKVYAILQFTISSFRINRLLSSEVKEKVDSYKEIIENTARSIPINKAIDRNTVGTYVEILGDIASSIESQINQTSSDQDISILKSIQNTILEQAIPSLNVALDDTDNLKDENKEEKDDENKIKNTKEKKALDHLRKIKSKNETTPKTKKDLLKDQLENILYYTKNSLRLTSRFGTDNTKERFKKESKKITREIKKIYSISEKDFSLNDIVPSKNIVKDIAKKHYSGNQRAMSYLKKIISDEVLPQIENIEAKMDEEELNTNQSN